MQFTKLAFFATIAAMASAAPAQENTNAAQAQ
jgi:hypothetical protein